jgi:hypothetical protein
MSTVLRRVMQGQLQRRKVPLAAKAPVVKVLTKAVKRRVRNEVPKGKKGKVARKGLPLVKKVPKPAQKRVMLLKVQVPRMKQIQKGPAQKQNLKMETAPKEE